MKPRLFLLMLLISSIGYGQTVNIPDANLKATLLYYYDTNNDNEIQVAEAVAVTHTLTFISTGVRDFTGLEAFTNIKGIEIEEENNITGGLDFTANTALESIDIFDSSLTNIILGQNVKNCSLSSINNFNTIDVSNASNLKNLSIYDTQLNSLDLSQNSNIESVSINSSPIVTINWGTKNLLKSLTIQGTSLYGYLDFSSFTALTFFSMVLTNATPNVTAINIANGNNTNFTNFNATGNASLTCIQVDDVTYSIDNWPGIDATASYNTNCLNTTLNLQDINTISDLKVYPNPVKNILNIKTIEDIKKVEIYNTIGKKVIDTNTTKINMGALSTGLYILKIHTNSGKTGIRRFIK